MQYDELADFIENKMRMSHIYQPVMLLTLLENGGVASETEIAKNILAHDQSQIEYYEKITRDMVGKVLRNHKIVERDKKQFRLLEHEHLTGEQIEHLKHLCQGKLTEYVEKRGEQIWNHRKKSEGYISGTLKYEVLKRAKFHCELCGISAEEKALEVDHIIPRNHGGQDDPENLQALCYSCNAMKRDRDDTDFHAIRESFKIREKICPFCEIPQERIVSDNNLAYSTYDNYPVTKFHPLIIPKRHVVTYFELGQSEINACHELLHYMKEKISTEDPLVTGYNVGINNGEVAGQSVFHCHIHLIPRRKGDMDNPRGGVRHVIPHKGHY